MTNPYEWLVDEPMLHEPVLVVALTGWIDAAASGATGGSVRRSAGRSAGMGGAVG